MNMSHAIEVARNIPTWLSIIELVFNPRVGFRIKHLLSFYCSEGAKVGLNVALVATLTSDSPTMTLVMLGALSCLYHFSE